jgi:hypothetical protein
VIQLCREVGWGMEEVLSLSIDDFIMWVTVLDEVLRMEAERVNG